LPLKVARWASRALMHGFNCESCNVRPYEFNNKIQQPPWTRDAPTYQISAKSDSPLLNYCKVLQ